MKKKFLTLAAVLLSISLCTGCGQKEEVTEQTEEAVEQDLFAMDTFMHVTAYGEHAEEAVEAASDEIVRLDQLLSTGEEESEVALLNQNGESVLSEDTAYLLERSMELYESTDGVFDIAVYPLMEAWGFTSGNYSVPEDAVLAEALSLIDVNDISYNKETQEVSFAKEGMQIDFGGIAKGYTSSRIMDIYEELGVTSGMVNLGGNVQVLGTKPDGSYWKVGIESPDKEDYLGILSAMDCAVITSGGYERYFEKDGVTYHHIIDPATGYPANQGLISVTIISEDGTLADALSTSLFIMGKDKAIEYWRAHSEEFNVILLTDTEELYITEGIAENFSSEREYQVIEKGDES